MSNANMDDLMAQFKELNEQLQEIMAQSKELETEAPKIAEAQTSLRQGTRELDEYMFALDRMTGNKNIEKATRKIQEFMMILLRLKRMLDLISVAEAADTMGLSLIIKMGANIAGLGISTQNIMDSS